jgi:hypothetical protein
MKKQTLNQLQKSIWLKQRKEVYMEAYETLYADTEDPIHHLAMLMLLQAMSRSIEAIFLGEWIEVINHKNDVAENKGRTAEDDCNLLCLCIALCDEPI